VSPGTDLKSGIARILAAHAMRVAVPDNAEWTCAMIHEQEHLPPDTSALSWALGCVSVSYRGRLGAMARLPDLRRWLLLTVWLLCLGPACGYFIFVAVSTAQGYRLFAMTPYTAVQEGLVFGSAALIGPIGLAAAFWTLSSSAHRLGTMVMGTLWLLTMWALAVPVGLLTQLYKSLPAVHDHRLLVYVRDETLTLFVPLFVLLPTLAVALLQWLEARRRRPLGLAG
jgi:hypothetical protein